MLYITCCILHAVYYMLYITCCILHAVYSILLHAVFNILKDVLIISKWVSLYS